jgi:hypothetical protein
MAYQIPIVYAPGGLDLRIPETLKSLQNARDGINWRLTSSLDLVKREGFQIRATNDVGYGLAIYEKRTETAATGVLGFGDFIFGNDAFGSATTLGFGDISFDLIGLDDVPKVWTTANFGITYSGANAASVNIQATSTTDITLTLVDNGATVLTSNLGTGTEGSPVDLDALKVLVDAVSNFTSTVATGSGAVPAAFVDYQNSTSFTSGVELELGVGYWASINSPLTTPLPKVAERITLDDFENPDTTSINGIMFMVNGFDPMVKYDGQNLYNAGMIQGSSPTGAIDTGTGVDATFDGIWNYRVTYQQTDAVGNIVEGQISSDSSDLDNSAGPYAIDVTLTNLLSSSGYNTNAGLATSTHTSTNVATNQERINLDNAAGGAHTLKVGDTAYFYDTQSSQYVTKKVLAVTSSTATLDASAAVGLTDNAVVSNQLVIKLWRGEVVGSVDPVLTDYKLVETIPNDPFNSTQVYTDIVVPASIGQEYVLFNKTQGVPPNCKYIINWRNQVVMAGDPANPTQIYYSEFADSISPENFPALNVKEAPQGGGGRITGMGVLDRNLFIFNEDRVYIGEGNLASDDLRMDVLADNIGCVAHHTIATIDNSIYFLSNKGVARITRSGSSYKVENVSQPIDPVFRLGANNNLRPSFKRAVATSWVAENKYVLHMPSETTSAGTTYANSDSRMYVFDIERNAWLEWSGMNAHGGLVEWDDGNSGDVLWFHSREASATNYIHRMNLTKSEIDYVDHSSTISGIDWQYYPQWDFLRSPKDRKIYTEISIDSFVKESNLAYVPTGDITVGVYTNFNRDTELYNFTSSLLTDDRSITESLAHQSVRSIGLKFSNSIINKQVLISGWALEARMLGQGLRRP